MEHPCISTINVQKPIFHSGHVQQLSDGSMPAYLYRHLENGAEHSVTLAAPTRRRSAKDGQA